MIEDALKKLGFTEKEITVYLNVLQNGKVAPANIASMTGIKRPTVYSVGRELIKKGVIAEDLQGASSYFVALPPENLNEVILAQEKKIREQKKGMETLIGELASIPKSKSYSVPKMRFIDEYSLTEFCRKQSPIWDESMIKSGNPTWWGFLDHTLLENKEQQEWIDWYWSRAPKEIDLKLLSNNAEAETAVAKRGYERRQVRFWKNSLNFTASTWIVGDYVVLAISRTKPNYLVEIHDAVYAENLRQVFKNLWEMIP